MAASQNLPALRTGAFVKASLVIPVCNAAEYLRECLDSALAQTLTDIEVICVDDGSTDGSPAILADYAKRDSRLRVLTQANAGTFVARKRAVAESRGEWIAFVDPDDFIRPAFCEKLLAAAADGRADIVQCGVDIIEMRERAPSQRTASERYFNPSVSHVSGDLLAAAYVERRIGWNLIFRLFRGTVARAAFAEMPALEAINETDALAFQYIAHRARGFRRISDRLYAYRYGIGISTCVRYTLDDYRRTLGKFDVLAAMPYAGEPACRAMAARMLDNSFKSAAARVKEPGERGEAWRLLEQKVGPERFLDYLAERFGGDPVPLIAALDEAHFLQASAPKAVRRVGLHYFRISRGGVQRVMLHIAQQLKALGVEVVLLLEEPPDETAFKIPDGLRVVMVPRSLGGRAGSAADRVKRLAAVLREERIDLFYTHAYASPMLVWDMLVCKRLLQVPVVVHYHAAFTAPLHYRIAPQAFEQQEKLLRMADRVIALSEMDAAYFRLHGIAALPLPNPMPEACALALDAPLSDCREKIVLWCGRDSWEKHPEDAKAIFSCVRKSVPDAQLVMLTGKDVDPYAAFRRASVFLNTSETEGFSMVSLEALAHGVPVVSYALGNLDLYRDNPSVVQVQQGDRAGAAEAVVALLLADDLSARRAKARDSVRWVRAFDHAGFWRELLMALSEAEPSADIPSPSAEMLSRIENEIAVGKDFQAKARRWRNGRSGRRLLAKLVQLVRKAPAFVRENGWRYAFLRTVEKAWSRRWR